MFQPFGLSPYFTAGAAARAALGGALLGVTVLFKTQLNGGVLGISGATRGLCHQAPTAGRLAFVLGLVGGGFAAAVLLGGMEPLPPAAVASSALLALRARLLCGSFCVGLGTALANGCTSGHGLTGLARLSCRSWVSVPTFMCVALVAGTLTAASASLPPDTVAERAVPPVPLCAAVCLATACMLLVLALGAWALAPRLRQTLWAKPVAELVAGAAFGSGLVISSMTRPSKIAAFLDMGSGAWDPSLVFVMCGALLITTPFFQLMSFKGSKWQPLLQESYQLPPTNGAIDRSLVAGSVLFGLGWGLCSACPGPAWVIFAARFSLESCLLVVGMVAGMGAWAIGRYMMTNDVKECGLDQRLLESGDRK